MSIFSVFTKFSPSSLVIFYSRAFKFDMLIPGVILHRTDLLEFLIFVYFILNNFFLNIFKFRSSVPYAQWLILIKI